MATISALVAVPLIMPTEDTLCPLCCRTWPLKCTEKSSGSELIPTKCQVTLECAHTLRSGEDQQNQQRNVYKRATNSKNLKRYWYSLIVEKLSSLPGTEPFVKPLIVYFTFSLSGAPPLLYQVLLSSNTPNNSVYSWWKWTCFPASSRLPVTQRYTYQAD